MVQNDWFEHCYAMGDFSLFSRRFAFVDTKDCLAASLFAAQGVRLHAVRWYQQEGWPYIFVACKVRKRDTGRFLAALAKLPNKMLLCGHPDYMDFCHGLREKLGFGGAEKAG